MKNSQEQEQNIYDEYEDLTLFADESFDTGDVDLFEFSSEDDSPLTRLKSIILSLDWEINDEILEELIEETNYLKDERVGDKIAGLYLQGLEKIGRYIKKRGAYAHHNAIKLLLTYYYNFEKISLTEDLSEDEISLVVQGDIRKFKILQYQISETEKGVKEKTVSKEAAPEEVLPGVPQEERDHIRILKASILGLDWEVTEEGLSRFNEELKHFHQVFSDDKPALVLVQGLNALGEYIRETKAGAHPESFNLLHSFSESLEQILATDKEQRKPKAIQAILVEQVNRLNQLKVMIAGMPTRRTAEDEYIEEAVDEIVTPLPEESASPAVEEPLDVYADKAQVTEEELFEPEENLEEQLDDLFGMESVDGMESSDSRFPEEILPPDAVEPVEDEVADDFIEAQVGSKGGLTPALSETEDIFGFNEDTEPLDVPAQEDLDAQLDKLFGEVDEGAEAVAESTEEPEAVEPALSDVFEPALAEFDLPAGEEEPLSLEPEEEQTAADIESKLDLLFGDEEPEVETSPVEVDTLEPEEAEVDDGFIPALADSDEEKGFDIDESIDELDESPLGDIEEKLTFFFDGADPDLGLTDEEQEMATDELAGLDLEAEEEPEEIIEALEEDKEPDFQQSLSFPEEAEAKKELENELDFFFDAVEDDEEDFTLELDEALPPLAEEILAETEEDDFFGLPAEEASATLDEALEDIESPDETEEKEVHLAALGALLPGVVRAPSEEGLDKTSKLISELKDLNISGEERVVLQFLQGVLSQLPVHSRFIDVKSTESLINSLYEPLSDVEPLSSDKLPRITEQFMVWQQGVIAKVVTQGAVMPTPAQDAPSQPMQETGAEVDRKQIREIVKEELDQIKGGVEEEEQQ